MKKLLTAILATCVLCITAIADDASATTATQTNVISGPGVELLRFLTTEGATNWMIASYGIYDAGQKEAGAGMGFGYKVSEYVVPTMRVDWLADKVWMPSASMQLQAPVRLLGKLDLVPFAFAGIATPISGRGDDNGEVTGIFGIGGAMRITRHWDVIGDYEKWSGFKGSQYRFGLLYKF